MVVKREQPAVVKIGSDCESREVAEIERVELEAKEQVKESPFEPDQLAGRCSSQTRDEGWNSVPILGQISKLGVKNFDNLHLSPWCRLSWVKGCSGGSVSKPTVQVKREAVSTPPPIPAKATLSEDGMDKKSKAITEEDLHITDAKEQVKESPCEPDQAQLAASTPESEEPQHSPAEETEEEEKLDAESTEPEGLRPGDQHSPAEETEEKEDKLDAESTEPEALRPGDQHSPAEETEEKEDKLDAESIEPEALRPGDQKSQDKEAGRCSSPTRDEGWNSVPILGQISKLGVKNFDNLHLSPWCRLSWVKGCSGGSVSKPAVQVKREAVSTPPPGPAKATLSEDGMDKKSKAITEEDLHITDAKEQVKESPCEPDQAQLAASAPESEEPQHSPAEETEEEEEKLDAESTEPEGLRPGDQHSPAEETEEKEDKLDAESTEPEALRPGDQHSPAEETEEKEDKLDAESIEPEAFRPGDQKSQGKEAGRCSSPTRDEGWNSVPILCQISKLGVKNFDNLHLSPWRRLSWVKGCSGGSVSKPTVQVKREAVSTPPPGPAKATLSEDGMDKKSKAITEEDLHITDAKQVKESSCEPDQAQLAASGPESEEPQHSPAEETEEKEDKLDAASIEPEALRPGDQKSQDKEVKREAVSSPPPGPAKATLSEDGMDKKSKVITEEDLHITDAKEQVKESPCEPDQAQLARDFLLDLESICAGMEKLHINDVVLDKGQGARCKGSSGDSGSRPAVQDIIKEETFFKWRFRKDLGCLGLLKRSRARAEQARKRERWTSLKHGWH